MGRRYYVRFRGRVRGPFTMAELQAMRRRRALSRLHELSLDRLAWIPAERFPELFSTTETSPSRAAGLELAEPQPDDADHDEHEPTKAFEDEQPYEAAPAATESAEFVAQRITDDECAAREQRPRTPESREAGRRAPLSAKTPARGHETLHRQLRVAALLAIGVLACSTLVLLLGNPLTKLVSELPAELEPLGRTLRSVLIGSLVFDLIMLAAVSLLPLPGRWHTLLVVLALGTFSGFAVLVSQTNGDLINGVVTLGLGLQVAFLVAAVGVVLSQRSLEIPAARVWAAVGGTIGISLELLPFAGNPAVKLLFSGPLWSEFSSIQLLHLCALFFFATCCWAYAKHAWSQARIIAGVLGSIALAFFPLAMALPSSGLSDSGTTSWPLLVGAFFMQGSAAAVLWIVAVSGSLAWKYGAGHDQAPATEQRAHGLPSDLQRRLRSLERTYAQGLLTRAEYEQKRAAIIDSTEF